MKTTKKTSVCVFLEETSKQNYKIQVIFFFIASVIISVPTFWSLSIEGEISR